MQASSKFNYVVVIESLPDKDSKTGKRIYDDQLMHINSKYSFLNSELVQVPDSEELLRFLHSLNEKAAKEGIIPFIHIECHGSIDGLLMADGSLLPWNRLRNQLIKINKSSRMNTIILVGACNGGYLINTASHMDGAPFFGVIGTGAEILSGEIEKRFSDFYSALFETGDANRAMEAINKDVKDQSKEFGFIGAEYFFVESFKSYYSNYCRGKGKKSRVEFLVSRVMQDPEIGKHGLKYARQHIKKYLSNPREEFNFFVERFFFTEEVPGILDRFSLDYDAIVGEL